MLAEPRCFERDCVHFKGVKRSVESDESTEKVVCKAYPEGIPTSIAYGLDLHLTTRPGDNGIVYEKKR